MQTSAAVSVVLSIFILMGVGALLTRFKWITDESAKTVAFLTVKVGLTGLILNNMLTKFDQASLIENIPGIAVSLLSILATLLIAWILSRVIRVEERRRGAFIVMFSFCNSIFIGVPVSRALFGDGAIHYTLLYYIANTSLFWSIAYYLLQRDSGKLKGLSLKKLLPLPMIVFLGCTAMVLLNWSLPGFVTDAAGYLGNMVTPLSLVYTGYVIMRMFEQKKVRWYRGYTVMLLGRLLLSPLLLWLTAQWIPLNELARNVLMMQAAMPVMSQTTIVAADVGADRDYAAGGVTLSTLISLLTIPLCAQYMLMLP